MAKQQSAARAVRAIAKPEPESGLGEMSDADRAALMGAGPILDPAEAPETVAMTAPASATPEEILFAARMMTLESKMAKLENAMEKWAAMMNDRPAMLAHLAAQGPAVVRKATREEEAAYCRWNFEASGTGELPFDGIQAWRDGGSPGLEK